MKKLRTMRASARKSQQNAKRHSRFNKRAIDGIASHGGALSPQMRKLCDAYANDMLGSQDFAPWLYLYSVISGEFREGWIPDNYFQQYYVERLSYRKISGPRGLGKFFFDAKHLPDIGYIVDGRIVLPDGTFADKQSAAKVFFGDRARIIFKADNSRQGTGIRFLSRNDFDDIDPHKMGNGVFQWIIAQHPAFDPISQNSLATLRLTTAHDDRGEFSLRGAFVHTGRQEDTFVAAKSAVRIAFDLENGRLSDTGYLPNWKAVDCHPDTQAPFRGIDIPSFQACKNLALKLHRQMPYVQCVGWDIAVDATGVPYLLEWNVGHTDIKFTEATQGPGFADLDWADRWRK